MGDSAGQPTVLVVDDDEDHCMMLEVALEHRGYHVLTAHSCRGAIDALQREGDTIDVLVCDLTLGDGTALDVIHAIGLKRPRVAVVLSGFDSDDEKERSLEAGFDAHLVKPTPIETLLDVITKGMRQAVSGPRLAKAAPVMPFTEAVRKKSAP